MRNTVHQQQEEAALKRAGPISAGATWQQQVLLGGPVFCLLSNNPVPHWQGREGAKEGRREWRAGQGAPKEAEG